MMFLLGSERSTLLTNIEGVPLKIPSESKVMLYQLTSPVLLPRELAAGVSGVVFVGSVWLRTVTEAPVSRRNCELVKLPLVWLPLALANSEAQNVGDCGLSAQFGFEAFNVFNHNYFGRDQFSRDPNSADFGSIFPSQVSTQNMLPRQIQVRFKFFW